MTGPGRAPRVPFALLVTALVVGGLALLLALNTASAANELRRHDLATRDARVAAGVQQLRNEVAASAAPANIARAAQELGMVPAANPAFIVLGPDGSVQVLGKPKAVNDVPLLPAAPATHAKKKKTTTPASTAHSSTSAPPHRTSTSTASSSSRSSTAPSTGAKPSPTPTPTPTITLPGGNR